MRLLRASGQHSGDNFDLSTTVGTADGDGGIVGGAVFVDYAEAALGDDAARLAAAQAAVRDLVGEAGFVDSAAIVSTFDAIDRIADATGMPLLDAVLEETADVRAQLGIDDDLIAEA